MARYKNIPVRPEVYEQVQALAGANRRGLGDQVATWAERELPTCEHAKQLVSIEIFGEPGIRVKMIRPGWYCPTCRRVYEYSAVTQLAPAAVLETLEPTVTATKKRRPQRIGGGISK